MLSLAVMANKRRVTAPLWTPADLATAPQLRLPADTGVTQSGGAVSAWADQSANAYSFAQATAANQPTYSATGFNGAHPAVTGDGTADYLQTTTNLAPLAQGFFVFAVFDNWTAGHLFRANNSAGAVLYASAGNLILYNGGEIRAPQANGAGTPQIVGVDSTGTGTMYVNGSNATTGSTGSTQTLGSSGQPLNLFAGGSGGSPANTSLAELMFFAAPPTSADRQRLEGWAAHKYGLTGLLAADHPYKSSAPTVGG